MPRRGKAQTQLRKVQEPPTPAVDGLKALKAPLERPSRGPDQLMQPHVDILCSAEQGEGPEEHKAHRALLEEDAAVRTLAIASTKARVPHLAMI